MKLLKFIVLLIKILEYVFIDSKIFWEITLLFMVYCVDNDVRDVIEF